MKNLTFLLFFVSLFVFYSFLSSPLSIEESELVIPVQGVLKDQLSGKPLTGIKYFVFNEKPEEPCAQNYKNRTTINFANQSGTILFNHSFLNVNEKIFASIGNPEGQKVKVEFWITFHHSKPAENGLRDYFYGNPICHINEEFEIKYDEDGGIIPFKFEHQIRFER